MPKEHKNFFLINSMARGYFIKNSKKVHVYIESISLVMLN